MTLGKTLTIKAMSRQTHALPRTGLAISRLARAAGVHVETIRYYQRRGLVPLPPKPAGGIRLYPGDTLTRLRFIKRAQELGFTLREVADLLQLGDGACRHTRTLAESKSRDIAARIKDLRAMQRTLERLIRTCGDQPQARCPIIEALTRPT